MSKLVDISHCGMCHYVIKRGARWIYCEKTDREFLPTEQAGPFPAWCPLPESGEKEESK